MGEPMSPPSSAAKQAAVEFFRQLGVFSSRVFDHMKLPEVSPWRGGGWAEGNPEGAILHYTADDSVEKAVRWFMEPSFNARASANVVVSDKKVLWMESLASDLPLMLALPVTVVQCVPPDQVSWHATWTCGRAYGIEATNIGELRRNEQGGFNCWYKAAPNASDWTTPWQGAKPINLFGRWFCPWRPEQIRAILQVLRHVYAFHGTFQRPWVIGHEQVQGDRTKKWDAKSAPHYTTSKLDPGPHFPLEGIREALFDGDTDIETLGWFQKFSDDQAGYAVDSRNSWIREWANADGSCMDDAAAFSAFKNHITILPSIGGDFGSVGKLALRLLGYHVSNVTADDLDSDDYQTICIFQRLQGLETDCHPGAFTRQALLERLQDRGFI